MITVASENYKKFGKVINISNGKIELKVTTDIGPRIIFFGKRGGENIMFEDEQDSINKSGEYFEKNLPGKGGWHIYGGHRLWKSPEDMATYYPDNSQVDVQILDDGAIFTSEVELNTKLKKSMKITMQENGEVEIVHAFTNCGDAPTSKISLWTLNVLDKGAVTTIKMSTEDTGFLPNRNLVYWSYSDINDSRIKVSQDKVVISWKDIKEAFKIGSTVVKPVEVVTKGMLFTVRGQYEDGAEYPDFSCNVEVYTNNFMMEVETISDMECIGAGQTKTHIENWTLTEVK